MKTRRLTSAVVVGCLVHVPVARADEPYFTAATTGSSVPTVSGRWQSDRASARLDIHGGTARLAPTTFQAGIAFAAAGRPGNRCPAFTMTFTTTSFVDETAKVTLRGYLRHRSPGKPWSRWAPFGETYVPRGPRTNDPTSHASGTYTPPRSCDGRLEYAWRVDGTASGETLLAGMAFDLSVPDR